MAIQLVVFDMAGTTVQDDDAVNVCLRRTLQSAGVDVDRESVNRVMGEPKPVALAKLLAQARGGSFAPEHADVVELYRMFEILMRDHYQYDPMVRAARGAVETFGQLRQCGIHVALDTGFNRTIADVILRRLGWTRSDLIDVTVTSDEVARGRPYPDLIERAMALIGISSPFAVAKVGDTPADLHEGLAAGCACVIGITTGSHTRESLAAHPHTHLVESLAEVPAICASYGC
jgi:phosphonatase-like hydrolase